MTETYDYIVCGGGTCGCAVAGRLAEDPSVTVLVIEAGDHSDDVAATQMAGGLVQIIDSPDWDWHIVDEASSGMNGRQTPLSRGKVLGGCSTCNGTLCIRGMKADYDDWGLEGWSGEEVYKYMAKAERFHEKDWFKADIKNHGYDGPIATEPHDLAPISTRILESMQSSGLPFEPDMFTTGELAHGCGHAPRTVGKGFRSTAAAYLTKENLRSNVTIMKNALIDKIKIEKHGGTFKASGVEVLKADRSLATILATKEILLSAGAYGSPAILLRSGIGSKDEVTKHGIEHYVNLPGVGKNLQDHLIVCTFYEANQPNLTLDNQLHHGEGLQKAVEQWMTNHTGFLSAIPFGSFAFTRLDDRLADSSLWNEAKTQPGRDPMGLKQGQPHVELFSTECYFGPSHLCTSAPTAGNSAFALITELFSPRSQGTVQLKSRDPHENPIVSHNYLEDPIDALVLAEGCRFANEIVMQGSGTKDIVKGSWPAHLTHHMNSTTEQWIEFVREQATTCYHPVGTCAMGNDDNPLAVLDKDLCVRGVQGLRVVDLSAMPKLINGHPQMAAYSIAEKAADLIKAAHAG